MADVLEGGRAVGDKGGVAERSPFAVSALIRTLDFILMGSH